MPAILSPRPGVVYRFDDKAAAVRLVVEGFGPDLQAAVTSLGLQAAANVSFAHTLQRMVHVYTFGERLADLQVSGATFGGACTQAGAPDGGFAKVLDYYRRYRLPARGAAVSIAYGSAVLDGLLVGGRFDQPDAQTGVGAFSLLLKVIPEE